jgi:hypothetical protein
VGGIVTVDFIMYSHNELRHMNDEELRLYLQDLTKEQVIEIAIRLSQDAERLRRELDDVTGVIR